MKEIDDLEIISNAYSAHDIIVLDSEIKVAIFGRISSSQDKESAGSKKGLKTIRSCVKEL